MFPKDKVALKVRKTLELLYKGTCDVVEYQKVKKSNGATGFEEVTTLSQQPCRLSFDSSNETTDENGVSAKAQNITLFVAPDVTIKSGSKIIVTQEDKTEVYKSASEPKRYASHQEIALEMFDAWA